MKHKDYTDKPTHFKLNFMVMMTMMLMIMLVVIMQMVMVMVMMIVMMVMVMVVMALPVLENAHSGPSLGTRGPPL